MTSPLHAICTDLARILDEARWAHTHGYHAAGRGLDAEHGTDLSRTEVDRSSGPVFDLEVGDHRARVAYQHAVKVIRRADLDLARALAGDGVTKQPPLTRRTDVMHPVDLERMARHLAWRLDNADEKRHAAVLYRIGRALDRSVRALITALDRGAQPYTAHKESPCKTCGIRERAKRKTECDTCATWRARHGGAARPKRLDEDSINVARAAQQRRLQRGEGWGVA